jgi:CrcB protein
MPIFIANMTSALLIGVFSALTVAGGVIGSGGKLLLTTGIMGGLSTFSSFVWGTHQMLANPAEQVSAIVYLVLSMVAGFLLVELGLWLGGRLMRSHSEAADAREEL